MVVFVSLVILFLCGIGVGYGCRGLINRSGKAVVADAKAEVAKVKTEAVSDVKAEVNKL